MHILRSTPATIEARLYVSATLTDFDATPTVAVTDGNGDAVSGVSAVSNPDTGVYRATIPGQADLTTLKAVWSGDVSGDATSIITRHEVVGNLLFTEAEARAMTVSGYQTPLADENIYSDSDIAAWRSLITDMLEERTDRPWTRRYCRVALAGNGGYGLSLYGGDAVTVDGPLLRPGRHLNIARVISATVDGQALDVSNIVVSRSKVIRTDATWPTPVTSNPRNIVLEYEYGPDPVPSEARENALRLLLANSVPNDVNAFATSVSNEDGTFRISTLPVRVEEWIRSVSFRGLAIA